MIRTHNHLVRKQALNHLAKLACFSVTSIKTGCPQTFEMFEVMESFNIRKEITFEPNKFETICVTNLQKASNKINVGIYC